jgi:hypothetical protein
MITKVKASIVEVQDGTFGGCVACGHIQEGVEPDGRKYECESCGARKVYGLEELIVMDLIDLTDSFDDE